MFFQVPAVFIDNSVRILYNADCPNSNNYEGDLHGSYF